LQKSTIGNCALTVPAPVWPGFAPGTAGVPHPSRLISSNIPLLVLALPRIRRAGKNARSQPRALEANREQTLAARRQRYANDPQYRERVKADNCQRKQRKKAERELLFPSLPKQKTMSNAERRLWRSYGLTQADYDFMAAAQNGVCAICERKPRGKLFRGKRDSPGARNLR
jgi:hypothetical protein